MASETRVVAMFRHRAQAQRAVDALLDAGFTADQITLTEPDHDLPRKLDRDERAVHAPTPVEAGFGATVGAVLGAIAGALLGWRRPRRSVWKTAGWAGFGACVGAGATALVARVLGQTGATPLDLEPVHYDQGSLERGRAMVTVDAGPSNGQAESILLEFGGREPGKWRTVKTENEADQPTPPNTIDDLANVQPATDPVIAATVGQNRV
jgi:hypothetical protein